MTYRGKWIVACIAVLAGLSLAILLSHDGDAVAPPTSQESPAGNSFSRIICMAPNITEAVFALGVGDRVVGVSDYTVYPPEAAEKPSVGALYNPNFERILALEPDLVIVQQKHEKVEALCRSKEIPVLRVNMEGGTGAVLDAMGVLGDRLGVTEAASALCSEIRAELARVRKRVEGLPRVKALACVDRASGTLKNIYSPGKAGLLTELIEIAGGENVFADEADPYVLVSLEAIVRRAPDVIVETRPGRQVSEAERREIVAEWKSLSTLPAVTHDRVFLLTDDFITVPGPRIGKIAARLAEVLHPEANDAR